MVPATYAKKAIGLHNATSNAPTETRTAQETTVATTDMDTAYPETALVTMESSAISYATTVRQSSA